ncbi:MAG: cobalamin B12-binding domain-containing protein [Bacteroidota bacterium]
MAARITDKLYQDYLSSLLSGEKITCRQIVKDLIDKEIEVKELYINLFQRSLYDVGELWENNYITVATEHLATSLTSSLMTLTYPIIFNTEKIGKKALVTAITNEYHQIGARMIADLMELQGWDTFFLGANIPLEDLENMIVEKEPDYLALSVAIYFNISNLEKILVRITGKFPDQKIIIGGQAFRWGGEEVVKNFKNAKLFKDILLFEKFLNETQWTKTS